MITKAIEKAFRRREEKQWEKTYWAIDLHETVIEPNWRVGSIPRNFYPMAKESLQVISMRPDIVTIMYTCSHPHEIKQYQDFFESHEIRFDYVNENPEVTNSGFGFYDHKPYFNVLFEDKAGFDAEEDWKDVYEYLISQEYKKDLFQ